MNPEKTIYDFPVGTRVRAVNYQYGDAFRVGKTGTVGAHESARWVYVDEDGGSKRFPYKPTELEVIAPTFAVGDRVRLADDFHFHPDTRGKTGTIVKIDPLSSHGIEVAVDGTDYSQWDNGSHLTPVIEPKPTAFDGFPVGARVEYRNADFAHPANGRQGEIVGQGPYGPKIKWDDGSTRLEFPYPQNVHLLPEPTQAEILRARADALSAEATAKQAEVDALYQRAATLQDEQYTAARRAAQYRAVADDLEAQQ